MGKRSVVAIGVTYVLLLAVANVAPVFAGGHNKAAKPNPNANDGIKKTGDTTVCQATDFKHSSCDKGKNVQFKELLKVAIKEAIEQVKIAKKNTPPLAKQYKTAPRTSNAFEFCNEAMDTAVTHLEFTLDKIDSVDWSKVGESADDIQTPIGSAYIMFTMCMDSFEDKSATTAEAKVEMEKVIRSAKQFIDKALLMANEIKIT